MLRAASASGLHLHAHREALLAVDDDLRHAGQRRERRRDQVLGVVVRAPTSDIDGEVSVTKRIGASAGFTLRYDGGIVISTGRWRCARNSAACTSTAAASMSRSCVELERDRGLPERVDRADHVQARRSSRTASRAGVATEDAIVSGLAPGSSRGHLDDRRVVAAAAPRSGCCRRRARRRRPPRPTAGSSSPAGG